MKVRALTLALLPILSLGIMSALPCAAQQKATTTASSSKTTETEKSLLAKMESVVENGKKTGSVDMNAVSSVLNEATQNKVSEPVIGKLVAMVVTAFPDQAPAVAQTAVKACGATVSESQVRTIVSSAVGATPTPFAAVTPVTEAVTEALSNNAELVAKMPQIASQVASLTPDSPLTPVSATNAMNTAEQAASNIQAAAESANVLPGNVTITPNPAAPVSSATGN